MPEIMKLLIAYDGSECSDIALADLERAGLPREMEVMVVTIAEVWVREELTDDAPEPEQASAAYVMTLRARQGLQEAETLARRAADSLAVTFPDWKIETRVYPDSPAWGVLRAADEWKPDLVVMGSHGRGALGRFILGSVSQKVLTEARGSVRIARRHAEVPGSPIRLVIGVDDTPDSREAVQVVAARAWPAGTSVRVVAAIEPTDLPIGVPMNYDVTQWVQEGTAQLRQRITAAAESSVETLKAAGLLADALITDGAPVSLLISEAESLGADAIVLGARGHRFMERFLLGSVSSAVAARAGCSVEVIRSGAQA